MAKSTRKSTTKPKRAKARTEGTKKLAKSVIALAATALLQKAVQKITTDPKVRRKAKAAGKKIGRAAKSAVKRARGG
jgi:hypothetical protein